MPAMPGVAAARVFGPKLALAKAHPGGGFQAATPKGLKGTHGSWDTTRTLAVAGGGHPSVAPIAASIRVRSPAMADWAPTNVSLLGLEFVGADRTRPRGALTSATPATVRIDRPPRRVPWPSIPREEQTYDGQDQTGYR